MACQDRKCTVDLFSSHGECEFVGQSDAAERDDLLRGVAVSLTPSIGWANCHDQMLDSNYSCLID